MLRQVVAARVVAGHGFRIVLGLVLVSRVVVGHGARFLRCILGFLAGQQPIVVRGDITRNRGGPSVRNRVQCAVM
eukprot:8124282-Heterocapsa_arctica.AAC.1